MTPSNGNTFRVTQWPFVRGIHRSAVNSPHKGQWRGALVLSFICAWINGWVNNGEVGDLRRHRTHYDVILLTDTLQRTICHRNPNEEVTLSMLSLTHWGRVTHIYVGKLTIIDSDNGLSPGRCQAIIWTSAEILLIGPLGTNSSQIVVGIQNISIKKIHLKVSSAKWRPFCLGFNVLITSCHWSLVLASWPFISPPVFVHMNELRTDNIVDTMFPKPYHNNKYNFATRFNLLYKTCIPSEITRARKCRVHCPTLKWCVVTQLKFPFPQRMYIVIDNVAVVVM